MDKGSVSVKAIAISLCVPLPVAEGFAEALGGDLDSLNVREVLAYAESNINEAIHAMQVMNMSDEVHPATVLEKGEICKLVCHIASFVGIKLSNFWPFPIARLMSGAAIPVDVLSTATHTPGTPITVGEARQRIANSFGVPVGHIRLFGPTAHAPLDDHTTIGLEVSAVVLSLGPEAERRAEAALL